ncbi:MAG TPA: phosphomevalonate kinase, partial [Myxococcaceae bacterium]|nr:phosphomevalonate kinase [Myxococcaceae bacterium]
MERVLSAPGKLFLSGEYAVLWGGTARVAAVGPRASAWIRRRADREVHLLVEEGRLRGFTTPLGVTWDRAVPDGHRFAALAVDLVLRAHGREAT